ncbi:MAG: 50S ribosomal protein L18 [Nitrospirota bacterium]|nr:50S ribosomal protein L18 [Nitrospirota bacterium]
MAEKRALARERRHQRVRKKVSGGSERPRLSVFRSLKYIYAQLIDDSTGHTLVSASSLDESLKATLKGGCNIDAAKAVGKLLGQRALDKKINTAVFDRSGYLYHGKIKALADAAREAGLQF